MFTLKLSELFTEINEGIQLNQTFQEMNFDEALVESPGSVMSSPLAVVWKSGSESDLHSELSKDSGDWSYSDLVSAPEYHCQDCGCYLDTSSIRFIKEEDYDADESDLEDQ